MIKIKYRKQEWELEGKLTVRRAINKVGLNPESVLAVRDGEVVTEDTRLQDGDEVRLVAVISGGRCSSAHTVSPARRIGPTAGFGRTPKSRRTTS